MYFSNITLCLFSNLKFVFIMLILLYTLDILNNTFVIKNIFLSLPLTEIHKIIGNIHILQLIFLT